ncbi:hypothetical protein DFJ58DRAFT_847157 [Suillus subalutaceus]|uniref:uncharacterized protein n=1 Tax=Suillus subalutaceus TaxID=48586 RepID=UPI001B85D7C7|nr:uncharacterized protein DFJ58DRAFT_847157 [Suillus subalutaceus]KAG1836130.1 hypothetical protein DFJ58DRAFT_847157 [Suillus subalutaceus]
MESWHFLLVPESTSWYYMVNLYRDLGFTGGIAIILSVTYDCCHSRNFVVAIIMDCVGHIWLLAIGLSSCMISLSLKAQWKLAQFQTIHLTRGMLLYFICFYACGIDATSYVYCRGMRKARDKAKAREQRRYKCAKRGKVARRKAELGESDMATRANCY